MQQALAPFLVSTVVRARERAQDLPPALWSAWQVLAFELPDQQLVLLEEVYPGSPMPASEMALLTQQVEHLFANEPDLAEQFRSLLAATEIAFEPEPAEVHQVALAATQPAVTQLADGDEANAQFSEPDTADGEYADHPETFAEHEAVPATTSLLKQSPQNKPALTTPPATHGGLSWPVVLSIFGVLFLLALLGYLYLRPNLLNSTDRTAENEVPKPKISTKQQEAVIPAETAVLPADEEETLQDSAATSPLAVLRQNLDEIYDREAPNAVATGEAHLKLADAYLAVGNRRMSEAHAKQAAYIFSLQRGNVPAQTSERMQTILAALR